MSIGLSSPEPCFATLQAFTMLRLLTMIVMQLQMTILPMTSRLELSPLGHQSAPHKPQNLLSSRALHPIPLSMYLHHLFPQSLNHTLWMILLLSLLLHTTCMVLSIIVVFFHRLELFDSETKAVANSYLFL